VTNSVPVLLHDLTFVPEGDDVVVGRLETGSYAILPTDGVELLRRLIEGMTPDEAAAWYERTFAEPVDVDDFLDTVRELGFVRDPDAGPEPVPGVVRLRRAGRAAFSAPAWVAYGLLVAAWLVVLVRTPDLLPRPSQVFFTGSLIAVQVGITLGQVPLLFLHEGFHILAGRRLGLPSRLGVSNRLTYIVFETQLNGVHSVPRRQRYLPFLAGLVADTVALAGLDLLAHATRAADGSFSAIGKGCLALAFTVVLRIAWQFQLFLRTDLYYVFATALNCYDLHDASKALLWNRVWRRLRRPDRLVDEQQWSAHDRRVGRWYGPFLVLGVGTFVAITVGASAPVVVTYFGTAFDHLGAGRTDALFWDSTFSLAVNAAQLAAIGYLARRKRRHRTAPRPLAEQGAL
jgi:hypothetical protein